VQAQQLEAVALQVPRLDPRAEKTALVLGIQEGAFGRWIDRSLPESACCPSIEV